MKNKSDQFRPASRATRGRALLIRVLLFALVAVSVLVMSGSVNRLLKAQAQSRAANAQLARIESETEALQSKWRPEEIKELEERFAKLPSLLFPEQEALGEWLRNLRSRADPLALDAKV
ncbi:MAG TPA: hypothetical protein PLW35_02655, partial [Verrucomicrobiota bacterium]|nr:hypothetical protein [Verrucomicrobiota bacterium]